MWFKVPRLSGWLGKLESQGTNGLVPVQIQRPENQKSWQRSFSLKSSQFGTRKEPMFQSETRSKKKKANVPVQKQPGKNSLLLRGMSAFLFLMFNQISEYPIAQSSLYLKLTIAHCHNSGNRWWTGKPGVLQTIGSQRAGHDWATELNWIEGSSVWRVRHSVLQRNWKNRSLDSWNFSGNDFTIPILASPHFRKH